MYMFVQMTLIVYNPPCRYLLAGFTWEKIWTNKTRTPRSSLIIAYRVSTLVGYSGGMMWPAIRAAMLWRTGN